MMNRIGIRSLCLAASGLLFMLLGPSFSAAQFGGLAGTVVDDEGDPVEGVEINVQPEASLSSRARRVITDKDGRFRVAGLTAGRYTLSYEKQGHESATPEVQVQIGERNRLGKVRLARLPGDWVDPGAQGHFDSGVAAARAEDYHKAVESFLTVLELAPNFPEVHYNIGFAYEKLEKMEKAIEQYEKALELRPEYYEPLIPLSDYHTRNQDWSRAAEYLKHATELRPRELAAQYNYGAVSMNVGDMDVAKAAFEKVLEIDPVRPSAHYQLGMIALSQARNEQAIAHLESYVVLDPEGAQAAAAKGIIETLKKQE